MKRDQRSWDCRLSHSVYPGREQQSEQPYAIFFKLSTFTFSFRITSHIVVGLKLFERLPVLVFSPRVLQMMNRAVASVTRRQRGDVTHDSNGATRIVTVVDQHSADSLDFFLFFFAF